MPECRKLIRDRIPEVIKASGKECEVQVLSAEAYRQELDRKLAEELAEYQAGGDVAELVDLVEVIYAILQVQGVTREDFEALRQDKVSQRGAFDQRLFLVRVSD